VAGKTPHGARPNRVAHQDGPSDRLRQGYGVFAAASAEVKATG
jgi:hypothetical protein